MSGFDLYAPVVEIDGLTVVRNGDVVIDRACLNVMPGDYVGLVGPNGGGKTTLVRAMLGQLPAHSGAVRMFGRPVETFDQWHRVAYVPQDAVAFDPQFPLSVRELVSLGRVRRSNLFRRLGRGDRERVDGAMALMGLSELADMRVGRLSGGQKQRAFVAKALASEPELLVLDEPSAGLDSRGREVLNDGLAELNRLRGTTLVVVSHDLPLVLSRMSRAVRVDRTVREADVAGGLGAMLGILQGVPVSGGARYGY